MAPISSRHAVTATAAGGLAFTVAVREHHVATDQPVRAGGSDSAPTPLELVSAALASCIALYVRKYCDAEDIDSAGFAVEVKPLWKEDPGRVARFDAMVHLPDTVPATHHAAIHRLARSCPVHNTLTHLPEITVALGELAGAVTAP